MSNTAAKRPKTDHADTELGAFLDATNAQYEKLHRAFEDQFWGTKMNLKEGSFSRKQEMEAKAAMEAMLADSALLAEVRAWMGKDVGSEGQRDTLRILEKTLGCYIMESEEAAQLRAKTMVAETALEGARQEMPLGYVQPGAAAGGPSEVSASLEGGPTATATSTSTSSGDAARPLVEMSSVGLRNTMKNAKDEATRRACYDGLRGIGPFICENGFTEIVKMRNRMAKCLGYADFYDYKVTQAEGFGKDALFEILDTLEVRGGVKCVLE